eukprot:TRINITY_DN3236_c0_g3_i2.p1 TRINITY_DN3236_c0_g3~~TRINITY_DN3236_c0_g3_i2.p1  ORF type:complete len:118 (-),score=2.24 TRINITY_DN3236_c0_g3_i2:340-693(-)
MEYPINFTAHWRQGLNSIKKIVKREMRIKRKEKRKAHFIFLSSSDCLVLLYLIGREKRRRGKKRKKERKKERKEMETLGKEKVNKKTNPCAGAYLVRMDLGGGFFFFFFFLFLFLMM